MMTLTYNINYLPNHVNESSLNPKVEPFYPSQNVVSDFTRYLLKKISYLLDYHASTIGQNLILLGKLDLLLKYTGTESQKHIISIKSSNVSDPSKGLERSWKRLEERYGYPKMLEASIKKKVESFPKLTVKDSK
jgi:hypothetical protein